MKKATFVIKHFYDYHEIEDGMEGWQREELGCFMPKEYNDCGHYFAVFWKKGHQPSRRQVIERLKKRIYLGEWGAFGDKFQDSDIDYKK